MTIQRAVLALSVSLALVCAVAGCSSSASNAQHAGVDGGATISIVSASGSSQTGPGSGGDAKTGKAVALCQLMPAATVSGIVGKPISSPKERDVASLQMFECDYQMADSSYNLSVTVFKQDAQFNFNSDYGNDTAGGLVAGLGDKAALTTVGLDALFGDVLIRVNLPDTQTMINAAKKLVLAVNDKL